ncbi:hypothetical protein BH10ACT1_BH10ACT1_33940 [soil metagenome]
MAEAPNDSTPGVRSVEGLDVNEVDDGLVVYDGDRDRVHYLNPTAGVVFALCTGEHAEAALPALVREVFGTTEPTDAEVADCLATLRAEGLVV